MSLTQSALSSVLLLVQSVHPHVCNVQSNMASLPRLAFLLQLVATYFVLCKASRSCLLEPTLKSLLLSRSIFEFKFRLLNFNSNMEPHCPILKVIQEY